MKIAIVTFEGFNEIDSFVALNILNRVSDKDWSAEIVAPEDYVTSMNGVVVQSQQPFSYINQADAVLFGSGTLTRSVVKNERLMAIPKLNPSRQLTGSQCSGALILKHLGLVEGMPICTDSTTAPWLVEAGAEVIHQPFFSKGNIATAGGCLSSQYLAAWIINQKLGSEAVVQALGAVSPVGEEQSLVQHVLETIGSPAKREQELSYAS